MSLPQEIMKMEILKILRRCGDAGGEKVLGARRVADELSKRGYEVSERGARYYLRILDEDGFTEKEGYAGRRITPLGRRELEEALIGDRLSLLNAKIDDLMYRTTFEPQKREGEVIVNFSLVAEENLERALDIIEEVAAEGYAVAPYIKIFYGDRLEKAFTEKSFLFSDPRMEMKIPSGFVGIATICNITVDGVMLKKGIPIELKYCGMLELKGETETVTDAVWYEGTSIDPIKIFMIRKSHHVYKAMEEGKGRLIVNYREVPVSAKEEVREVLQELKKAGIGGKAVFVEDENKVGILLYSGMNAIAAVEEGGIKTMTVPRSGVLKFEEVMNPAL